MKIACPNCRQKLDVTDVAPFARISCPRCGGDVIAPKPFGSLLLEEPLGQRLGVSAYRALDLTLDREVLVKILDQDVERFGESFQALACRAAAVNHVGVIPVYSCGAEEGLPYLVTQFMVGGALAYRLQDCSVSKESSRQGMEWCRSIAGGLQAAAAQGVVHGAIAPHSIFLDADGHAKLGDFGLDVLLAGSSGRATAYPSDVAPYLSPEVLNGSAPTSAADVFGLGAVLYHVLVGNGPCGAVADGEAAKALWQAGHRPPSPRSLNSDVVSQEISDLCMRMLHGDPGSRPADLSEITELLASACQTRALRGMKSADKRAGDLRPAVPRVPRPPRQATPRVEPRRDRWMNALISGCIVVVVVLGMVLYVRTQGYPSWVSAVGTAVAPPENGASVAAAGPAPGQTPSVTDLAADRPATLPGQGVADRPAAAAPDSSGPGPDGTPPAAGGVSASGKSPSAIRSYAPRRPRPNGLDFMGARSDLARYLRELPPELLAAERERIDLIGDTRDYVIRLMKYVPFLEGQESDIRLRSGPPLRGAIPYCNDTQVAIRVRGSNALQMVAWRDLAIEQVIAFLDFYIHVRLDQGQIAGGAKNTALRQEVAEDCLRTAVLCDWYGRPQEAGRYARQAVEANPAGAAQVMRLLPDVAR